MGLFFHGVHDVVLIQYYCRLYVQFDKKKLYTNIVLHPTPAPPPYPKSASVIITYTYYFGIPLNFNMQYVLI